MNKPKRKTTRLQTYDYRSQGVYHVTICAHNHSMLFGTVNDGSVTLSDIGQIIDEEILMLPQHYINVDIDKYVVMPNHVHILIAIKEPQESKINNRSSNPTLGQIIGALKAGVTRRLGRSIWQARFYEHIIREERDYMDTVEYIQLNPIKWQYDRENPDRVPEPVMPINDQDEG